jgi:DNA-directed RNA polymerase specialized sigma24 family protein
LVAADGGAQRVPPLLPQHSELAATSRRGSGVPADLSSQCAATPFSDPAELTEPGLWAHDAIASLPDRQRRVMAAHIEGRTNQQIADDLGVSNASVRQSLRRARRALSKRLRPDADDERG